MNTSTVRKIILAKLEDIRVSHGVKKIESYSGEFAKEEDLNKLSGAAVYPSIYVSSFGGPLVADEEGSDIEEMQFAIFVATKSYSKKSDREDEATDILDAIKPLFHKKDDVFDPETICGVPITKGKEVIFIGAHVVVYATRLIVPVINPN